MTDITHNIIDNNGYPTSELTSQCELTSRFNNPDDAILLSVKIRKPDMDASAAARIVPLSGHPRKQTPNYNLLPSCYRWVYPNPFSAKELAYGERTAPLIFRPDQVTRRYYPLQYYGIRQGYSLKHDVVRNMALRRGSKIIVDGVHSSDITYRVNRIRLFRGEVADVEVVAVDCAGNFYLEDSPTWPPLVIEVPLRYVSLDLPKDTTSYLLKKGVFHRAFFCGPTFQLNFPIPATTIIRFEEQATAANDIVPYMCDNIPSRSSGGHRPVVKFLSNLF